MEWGDVTFSDKNAHNENGTTWTPVSTSDRLWLFQSLRKDPLEEEAYKEAFSVVAIPPSTIVRRLAAAIE